MWALINLERCNRIRRKLSENFYVNFSCWTYWFLLIVYFSYLGFGAWMFARARQLRVNDSSAVSLTTKKTLSRTALKTEFGEKLYFSINGNLVSKDLSC